MAIVRGQYEVISCDGDDTLWHCERGFAEAEQRLKHLLVGYADAPTIKHLLFDVEMRNLKRYGYGIKSFTLSMITTALELSEGRLSSAEVAQIIEIGHDLISQPVDVIPGVHDVLESLSRSHDLWLVTKGDLFDQEAKLDQSGLAKFFRVVQVVADKTAATYQKILSQLGVPPHTFAHVGDSLRSDIIPVLELGGTAIYVPYHITWAHEQGQLVEAEMGKRFAKVESFADVPSALVRCAHDKFGRI